MSMNFCKNFVTLRRVHGYTQETIAEKCGVSRQAIAKWEAGASLPDMYKLVDIAKMFDVRHGRSGVRKLLQRVRCPACTYG